MRTIFPKFLICLRSASHNSSVAQLSTEKIAAVPLRSNKLRSCIDRKRYFIDFCNVTTIGGSGGNGCIAFMQLWKNPLAGPSGGDGGNGGHVIFKANQAVKSLDRIGSVVKGEDGEGGMGKSMHGACGKHNIVDVPVGTLVKKDFTVVADLNVHDTRFIAARGGAGGHGNQFFLSNKNRHPEVAEVGADGEIIKYTLELSVMAHVGLVGFPNAGKSTLLRAISRARPKVAAYPFTTLNPHVGIVHYDDYIQLAVADLPGIIPDAHKNRGLGISFLKHIKRCVCILYVIDLSLSDPLEQLQCLQYEMEQYEEGLSKRPCAVVANKFDLPEAQNNLELLTANVELPVYPISAKCGHNVRVLLDFIRSMYDDHNKQILVW